MNGQRWRVLLPVLLLCGVVVGAYAPRAAGAEENPPEILTSELSLRTRLESKRLEVNFVVVDTARVTEVKINGEPQRITPGDTVLITRVFEFSQDVTQIEVQATNAQGLTRTVVYTAYLPGVDPARLRAPGEEPELRYFASYNVRYEDDSNPSLDLSAPISIGDSTLTGVVPDSEQADTRTNLLVSGGVTRGIWTVYAGLADIAYSKAANSAFDVRSIFLGGRGTFAQSETNAFLLGYVFSDVDVGGFDYAQAHTVTPAWRRGGDHDNGTWTSGYSLSLTQTSFARGDLQEDASTWRLEREYTSLDPEQLDRYRSVMGLGTSSEGTPSSEHTYVSFDFDWNNRWDSGLLLDFGLGVQWRDYDSDTPLIEDTPLGSKRVDIPLGFSTGLGWLFRPTVKVLASYSYLFNLSNKTPYEREILALGVSGAF